MLHPWLRKGQRVNFTELRVGYLVAYRRKRDIYRGSEWRYGVVKSVSSTGIVTAIWSHDEGLAMTVDEWHTRFDGGPTDVDGRRKIFKIINQRRA